MIRIGLSSYSLYKALAAKEMDIFGAIDFIAENGAEEIEMVPCGLVDLSDESCAKIVAKAKDASIGISSYTIGASFVQPDAQALRAEINRVKGEVEIAAKLGVTRMRHDCASRIKPECTVANLNKDLPIFIDACGEIADYAAKYGITTSIENHGFYMQGSERVQRLVLGVNRDNFRTTMDVGNFLCADEDPVIAAMNNLPFASMIHFKDFHIRHSAPPCVEGYIETLHGRFIRGAVTGDGDVDLVTITRLIKESGYDGSVSIEYEGWDECKNACKRAIKNVKALFGQ